MVAPQRRRPLLLLALAIILLAAALPPAGARALTPALSQFWERGNEAQALSQGEDQLSLLPLGEGPGMRGRSGTTQAGTLAATLSATTENAQSTDPSQPPDLLIRITLDNQTGADVSGLALQSPVPDQTQVLDSWLGQEGQQPGAVIGKTVSWPVPTIAAGSQAGPFAYRVAPDDGVDGATIFVDASVQPSVGTVAGKDDVIPAAGSVVPVLPLNGLWGEQNLRRTVLPSGLTIFTQERPDTPTVALRLAVRAGSRDENDANCGGSHWIEHAQYLGTPTRPDNQAIGAAIESIGGDFNAETGWEATDYWNLVPADKFSTAVDVLSDQMLNTNFATDAFDREKQVVIQETTNRENDPDLRAFDDFLDVVFQISPLVNSPAAVSCLPGLSDSDILAYRAQHYVTSDIAIAASGRLTHDDAVAMLSAAFAGLPVGPRFDRPVTPEPIETEQRLLIDGTGTDTDTVRLGWPVAGIDSPDWAPTVVLASILGDTGERLAQRYRDSNLFASGTDAEYVDFSDAGALMLSTTTQSTDLDQAVPLALMEVQRLRDGDVSDDDVQEAVRAVAGQRALAAELNLDQTDRATAAVSDTLLSYDEVLARLEAVTPADVQRVAQTYLNPSAYSIAIYQH